MTDLNTTINEKLIETYFWDDVFSAYFSNQDDWRELKGKLWRIYNIRNKVSHHRWPIKQDEISELTNVRDEVLDFIEHTVPVQDAKRKIEEIVQSLGSPHNEYIEYLYGLQR